MQIWANPVIGAPAAVVIRRRSGVARRIGHLAGA